MNRPLQPYKAYKESGIEWLGRVPEHWEVVRGKQLYNCVDSRSKTGSEELLTVSSKHGVIPRSSASVTMFKAESYIGYKLCWPDDLVINSLWAWSYGLGVSDYHGIISSAYGVYRLKSEKNNAKYFGELVRSRPFNWELTVGSKGIWISRLQLTDESFLRSDLPLPPPDEQEAIVRYLSEFESKYRGFMRNRQQLTKLLREQKQALINQAVTKGLNPNAPMKETGIEWLGKIPEHWEVRRLKTTIQNINEQTSRKKNDEIYLAMEHVESWTGKAFPPNNNVEFDSKVKCFQANDVLFGRLRPYLAKVTRPTQAGVCVGEFLVLRVYNNSLLPQFLEHFMRSKKVIDIINRSTYGAKMPRASWSFIGSIGIVLPPLDEQAAICEYIERVSTTLDASIATAERELELMAEYRTRLIADVVTGKVDVRSDRSDKKRGTTYEQE